MVWASRYENSVVEGFGAQGLIRTPSFRIGRRPDECPPPSYSFLTQAPSHQSQLFLGLPEKWIGEMTPIIR